MGCTIYSVIFNSNPKTYFTNIINKVYEKSKEVTLKLDENKYDKQPVNFAGELKIDTNIPEVKEYSNYKLNYNLGMDYANKKMILGAGLADESKTLIDISSYLEEGFGYLKSNTIFSDIIKFEDETINEMFSDESQNSITGEDLDYLIKITKDEVIKSLDEKDFKKEKTKIDFNGKNISVKKITYVLDNDKQNKIANNIRNAYKNDDKILTILSNISGEDKNEIKTSLDENINNESSSIVTVNLYVKGNNILKYEANSADKNNNSTIEMLVDGNVYTISMSEKNSSDTQKIVITKESDKKNKVEAYYNDTKIVTFDVTKENDNKINIVYNIDADGTTLYGTVDFEEAKENDKKTNYKFNMNLSIKENDTEYTIKISNNLTEEYVDKLNDIDTSKAIDASTLSDDYFATILTNIQNKLAGTPFEDLIKNIMGISSGNMYNDSYNYNEIEDDWDTSLSTYNTKDTDYPM